MIEDDRLWLDSYGFVYSGDGKRLLKGANVKGAYWIPEGVEEIEPEALLGCRIGMLHIPRTAHVHDCDQLVFSEDPEENEEMMPAVYFWTKDYANRDEETCAFEDEGEFRIDEHGIAYSLDGHRPLFTRLEFTESEYHVPDGVVTICSMAFATCWQFVTLIIPRSVRLIGDFVFGPGGGKIVIRDRKLTKKG
ncbi:MAG: hypothetical protein II949_04995 [Prevotella sp.]|nr:hypothetical protein [Prevotella sp.]